MARMLASLAVVLIAGLATSSRAAVMGQWDFNSSNLTATVGTALAYRGDTANTTVFMPATIE
ncbi:MAG: hypothetical protein U1F83_08890 [Verrucomicrobiota bacterium]